MPAANRNYENDIEDVEYLRHGNKPLMTRMFKPRGQGPFPAIIDLHGGAWNLGDRLMDTPINEPLAKSGVVVMALDFRMPPEAPYPASMADINYAIRWFKAHAGQFGSRPDLVGLIGSSSGGHQAILAAMRPGDSRYSSIPLPSDSPKVDASVRCAILCWPVIDPLGRYRYAKKFKAAGAPYPEFVDLVLPLHDKYWKTEDAMAEGNPALALERGERVETHRSSIFRAQLISSIRALTSTASSSTTVKRAAALNSRCPKMRPRVISCGGRKPRLPFAASQRLSTSFTHR